MALAPWVPNIALGAVGLVLVVWRAGPADRPIRISIPTFRRRHGSAGQPLRGGEVIASDVFAVFPKENLGVRAENTVLITETGCENLSTGLPREISEIEADEEEPQVTARPPRNEASLSRFGLVTRRSEAELRSCAVCEMRGHPCSW